MQPVNVIVPVLKMPPPDNAESFEIVQSVNVVVPRLSMPPPLALVCPPEKVKPEIVVVTPFLIVRTLKLDDAPPPSIVSDGAPGPLIVTFALRAGKALVSWIAPVTLKSMVLPVERLASLRQ